jgi:diguanylate cyclase (GGDEF)-like protein
VVIFDLDHFKAVNDTYGHQAGDEVLRETARRVKNTIRPYDIFARYGGEEFIILITDMEGIDRTNVINAVERIRTEICNTPVKFENTEISVSSSFGIAYAAPKTDMNTATKRADEALYQAKNQGRNRVVFYEGNNDPNEKPDNPSGN